VTRTIANWAADFIRNADGVFGQGSYISNLLFFNHFQAILLRST
jgi:hypothetical protein